MILTLNQIVGRLQTLSLSHRQVNHFFFGNIEEFDSQTDITYPACFCEQQPGGIDYAARQQRFSFRLYFVDLVHVSERTEENETDVLSDMTQVAGDLLSMLLNPIYQDDWLISDSAPVVPVTESLNDLVAGVVMDITILVDYLGDSCAVPADDVEFDQTFDMARTKIYTYNGTGSEGNVISIPTLSGKHILALWRADGYKRAIATAPTDAGKIQVGTVDLGSGKGILGSGTITMESGDGLIIDEKLDILYYST